MKYFKKISFLICCVLPLCFAGCKPVVTINAPANGDTFAVGETIAFAGEATDTLHPNLDGEAYVWTSDKDGEIGTGASFRTADLSEGEHVITLTVKDPNGLLGQSSVSITIGNGNVPTTTTTIENTPTTTSVLSTTTTTIAQRFTDNNNGTVTDTRTGLIWLKNANADASNNFGYKTWAVAVAYCNSLASGTAGLTDGSTAGQWRLPSVQEFEGIGTDPPTTYCLDGSCYTCPAPWTMPGTPFTNVQSGFYWSSTEYAGDPNVAWLVYMGGGDLGFSGKSGNDYVWAVWGGN